MKKTTQSYFLLIFITFLWGSTFPVISVAAKFVSSSEFVLCRFIIAACLMLPWIKNQLRATTPSLLLSAFILGCLNAISYTTQTTGLKTISPSVSAFITGLSVVIIPMLSPLFGVGKPRRIDLIAILIAILGLFILTGANFTDISIGERWTAVCALSFAIEIVYLQKATRAHPANLTLLAFYQIVFTALFSALTIHYGHWTTVWNLTSVSALLYCSVFATVTVFMIQTHYQRYIPTTHAGLIYMLEPIFATMLSFCFLHERILMTTWIGGGLILASLVMVTVL